MLLTGNNSRTIPYRRWKALFCRHGEAVAQQVQRQEIGLDDSNEYHELMYICVCRDCGTVLNWHMEKGYRRKRGETPCQADRGAAEKGGG